MTLNTLINSKLFGLLLVAVAMLAAAWQAPFSYKLDPNSDLHLDEPFVQNFNAVEPANGVSEANPFYYRWSKGEGRLVFPGVGRNSYRLTVSLTADPNPNRQFQLFANDTAIGGTYQAKDGTNSYQFEIPPEAIPERTGNLTIYLKFEPFSPKGDSRKLGFALLSAELSAVSQPIIPPLLHLAYLLTTLLLIYLIAAVAGVGAWAATLVSGICSLILAWAIISPARIWLTIFEEKLVFAFALAFVATLIIAVFRARSQKPEARSQKPEEGASEHISPHPPLNELLPKKREQPLPIQNPKFTASCKIQNSIFPWVLVIFGLSLAVRFAGLIYPGAYSVDIGFHVNRYNDLWENGNFFGKIVSAEWGGRETYYPPTTYLFAGLFRWLFEDTITLLRFWMSLFEASRVLLIFFLVKRATGDERAGLISALLMATMPVALISLSFAQVAQLMGEWVTLAILCVVVVYFEKLRKLPYFIGLLILLVIAFLQHPGVIILTGATFFGLAVVLFFRKREGGKVLLLIYGLAMLISVVLYHRVTLVDMLPQAYQTLESKITGKPLPGTNQPDKPDPRGKFQVGGSVSDTRLGLLPKRVATFGELITGGIAGFWKEAQVYYQVVPLLLLPFAGGWLWRTSRPGSVSSNDPPLNGAPNARRRLAWAMLISSIVVVLFALMGLFLNLYVRYSLFWLPLVAAGSGITLSYLWQRFGLAGRLLTIGICSFIVISGLVVYYDRIFYYIDFR